MVPRAGEGRPTEGGGSRDSLRRKRGRVGLPGGELAVRTRAPQPGGPLPGAGLRHTHPFPHAGRCWLDALELALRCSSLLRLSTCKQGSDREPGSSPDASPSSLCGLPPSATSHDQDLFP